MKIKILLITFFLNSVFAGTMLAQEKGEITFAHSCFKQLDVTVKNYGYLKDNKAYGWGIKIKNNYKTAVKFTYKLTVGDEKSQGGQPTYYIEPGKTWAVDWGRLALLLKNSSSTEFKVDIWGLCFEGYDCSDNNFFDCDGRQIKEKVFGSSGNTNGNSQSVQNANKSNNQNNSSSDSPNVNQTSSQTNIMELMSKKNNLCEKFNNLIRNGENTNPTFVELCTGNQSNYSINDHARLNNEIARLESAISMMNKQAEGKIKVQQEQQKRQQEEQERIRKAQEAKRAQFDGAIQNGDNALNSKQYDSAMSYYNLAKNSAQNSAESTLAQNRYNQAFEAKKTAERQVRVAKQQEKDKKENLEYAGLATSVGGMMALLNDSYSYKWYAMKFQAGLGYENFPIYSNNASQYHVNKSYIESFTLPTFHMGFKSGFFNNKAVSFTLNPLLNAGFSALSAGISGGYVEYGSTATLYLSHKSHSKFKVFAEGGYFNREGNYSYDEDAARGGNSATDDVRKGTFKYDIMKYGGGIMFHWVHDGKETYIRPAAFFEKPSFFAKDAKPVLNYNFQVNISSEIIFDFSYSTDYFIGGEVTYPTTLQPEKMDYFSIKIIKQGKLY